MKIFVVGYPSLVGGADQELSHQISVWQDLGFEVHLIHTGDIDENLKAMKMEERGCVIEEPLSWKACKGHPVIAYCNAIYLENLQEIREHASQVWWAGTMSWLFPNEKTAHKNGLIDWFIYQTDFNMNRLSVQLERIKKGGNYAKINPYFDADRFKFCPDPPDDKFRFCKISREDADKYSAQSLWLYDNFTAPMMKEGHILGWNPEKMEEKCGELPNWIDAEREGARPVEELYEKSHALIHFADPCQTENLPRVGFEAMATGTVLIVDNRGGWKEEVVDGETGWLCDSEREFSYKASRCAFEKEERLLMAGKARDRLSSEWGMDAAKENWSNFFNDALR